MNDNSELRQIEMTIDQAKEQIELLEALNRLRKNKDFDLVIEKGYLEKEACRLVLAKGEPALQSEEQQKHLDKMMIGVAYFRQYLHKIYQFGNQAQMALKDHENTRDEIMAETH
jgi:hypothetical protein